MKAPSVNCPTTFRKLPPLTNLWVAALAVLLMGVSVGKASATLGTTGNTDVVTSNADDGSAGTLRSVIANAAPGDTITFAPNISHIVLTQGSIYIEEPVTITGPGASNLAIDANGASEVFSIYGYNDPSSSIIISGLTLENGPGDDCVIGEGYVYMTGCNFTGSHTPGIATNFFATPSYAVYNFGTVTLTDCNISNNDIGIYNYDGATLTVNGGSVTGNSYESVGETYGVGIYNGGGASTVSDTTISNNGVTGFSNSGGTANLTDSTLNANGTLGFYSGGEYNDGRTNYSAATLTGCTVSGNGSSAYYGTIAGGLFLDNSSTTNTATVNDCTVSGNSGSGFYLYDANVNATNCTITGNTTNDGYGGGVYVGGSSAANFTNCTLTGNSTIGTHGTGYGGGLAIGGSYVNGSDTGAGAVVLLTNDIFWDDSSGDSSEIYEDYGYDVGYSDFSLIVQNSDIQGGPPLTTFDPTLDIGDIDADPLFVNAPTDLHLKPNSPCIAAGATQANAPTGVTIPTTDFDGNVRPPKPSIGAFDVAYVPVVTTTKLTGFSATQTILSDNDLTANITAADGTTPSGSVSFYEDGTDIGDMTLTNGQATLDLKGYTTGDFATLTSGNHTLVAKYTGSTLDAPSASATQTVDAQTSTTAYILVNNSSANQSVPFGQPVTLTAGLLALLPSPDDPSYYYYQLVNSSNPVIFYDGTTPIGTAQTTGTPGNAVATLTVSNLAVGTHSLTVSYPGDVNDAPVLASATSPVLVAITSVTAGTARVTFGNVVASQSGDVVTVTGTLLNSGTATATDAQITRAVLGTTAANTPLAGPFTIPAGGSQTITLKFTTTKTGREALSVSGTAAGGLTFSSGSNIFVP